MKTIDLPIATAVLRYVAESFPECLYWKNVDLEYIGCNQKFADLIGLESSASIIGMKDTDFSWLPERVKKVSEEDRSIIEEKKSISYQEIIPIPATGEMSCFFTKKEPLYDTDGNIIGILGIATEIQSNRPSDAFVAPILSNLPQYVYWKNNECIYMGCNQGIVEMFALKSSNDFIGLTDRDFGWDEERLERLRKEDHQILETGQEICYEEWIPLPKGETVCLLTSKKPLLDLDGNTVGILGVSTDITLQKKLENNLIIAKEQAEVANKAKTEFIENMSHDLRTPLAGLSGAAEKICLNAKDSVIQQSAREIVTASQSLLGLLNEILDYSSAVSGSQEIQYKKIDLFGLSQHVMDLFSPSVRNKGLEFHYYYDENLPRCVISDGFRLKHILLNLLSNALKFTEAGSIHLHLVLKKKSKREITMQFIVEDTGLGIPLDKQEIIYERFSKLKASYQDNHFGFGLGLSIIKKFVQDLDGEITVKSAPGSGARFTCTLALRRPLLEDQDDDKEGYYRYAQSADLSELIKLQALHANCNASLPAKREEIPDIKPKNKNTGLHILLVEDNALAAKAALIKLKVLQCTVDWVDTGEKAVAAIKTGAYHCIFMDIGLPDKDGYEVTRLVRAWEAETKGGHRVPIVALTAHVDPHKKVDTESILEGVLTKPLNIDQMLAILHQLLEPELVAPLQALWDAAGTV